jgi:DNA uptake protein ComE-like DNA-binding protein
MATEAMMMTDRHHSPHNCLAAPGSARGSLIWPTDIAAQIDPRAEPGAAIRRGSVLLLVLVVIAMLTLGTATYLDLMQNERKAVRHHGRAVQAGRLAESGVEYVKTLLALTPAEIQQAGGLTNNPATMAAVIIDDQTDPFDRGRATILSPAQIDGLYVGYKYGLENESAKLNVNTLLAPGAEEQAANRLLAIGGMTPEIADAILDWLDADENPRPNGAEFEAYQQLVPSYEPRNGPIADLDELLLVRGVTPELLYGVDQNRNFQIEANELPRGLLVELDNTDGSLNGGWSAYLTVSSVENLQPTPAADSPTATKIDLNGQNLQDLFNELQGAIGADKAKFIIAYRQYGAQPINQGNNGQPGGVAPGAGVARQGQQNQGDGDEGNEDDAGEDNGERRGRGGPGGNNGNNGNQGNNQSPVEVSPGSLTLNFETQGGNQLNTPLDLIAVRVQIPGENNQPPKIVNSPWMDNTADYRELLKLYDVITPGRARRVAGRVNINRATRPVLRSIPGLPAAAIGKIVARREVEPDMASSDQRHSLWLLIEGIVTLDEMRQLDRYITTGGDAFSGQTIGFFDAGPSVVRGEFIVDRSGATPRLRAWRDLSTLGRGFTTVQLGVDAAEAHGPR